MIEFRGVHKTYDTGIKALKDINIRIDKGEFVFIVGASGAGKSTFLKLIMREEVANAGEVIVNDFKLSKLRRKDIPYLRRTMGIVFQDFRLLAFPLGENVAASQDVDAQRARECLARAGLGGRLAAMPEGLETPLYKDCLLYTSDAADE